MFALNTQHVPGTQQVTESGVEHAQLAYRRPVGIIRQRRRRKGQNEWQSEGPDEGEIENKRGHERQLREAQTNE